MSDKVYVENTTMSDRFNAADADVTFQSSDHVLFRLHRINLQVHAEGFAPPGFETNGEVVQLTENSSTLELLFQFIYPNPQPDVETMKFKDLALLAEAAEKYQVFSAISICRFRMRHVLPAHPHEIMNYAIKHGYNNIIQKAALVLVGTPLHITVTKLPPNTILPWVLYYEQWNQVLQKALSFNYSAYNLRQVQKSCSEGYPYKDDINYFITQCNNCANPMQVGDFILCIVLKMKSVQSLLNLDVIFKTEGCCEDLADIIWSWQRSVEEDIRKIKPFVNFL